MPVYVSSKSECAGTHVQKENYLRGQWERSGA